MQALSAVLNTAGNMKPTTGSRSSQTDSLTMMVSGEKRSFTDIFEQLFAMFPTAASANTVGQSEDKQGLFANVLGQKAEVGSDKGDQQANETILPGILLTMPAVYIGQPDKTSVTGTIVEAVVAESEAKPVVTESAVKPNINKTFAATGEIPFALLQMQPVTPALETTVSGSNIQQGISPTNHGSIALTALPQQEVKPAALKNFAADQPNPDEPIVQNEKESKTIAVQIQPGNGSAATTSFSTEQVFNVPTSQKSKDSRIMTATEMPVTENAAQTVNSETARLEFKKAVGTIGQESKIIVTTEQPAGESPREVTTGTGKDKPVIDVTARPTDKEYKNLASINKQQSDTVKSAVADISAKSVAKKSIQASGDEIKLKSTAAKKTDIAAADTIVKLDPQPSLNNIQAATERPRPERTVMSKSQIEIIANSLAGQINSGTSSLEINLQPESLGKIQLMFQMDDGSLSVRIIAHAEETRNLLDASLQNIKESLNQQGIKVNDMSLDLANQEKHGNQNGSGYREASRPMQMVAEKKESYNNTEIWEQNSTQYRRLNILA